MLFFVIAPTFVVAAFFLPHESWRSKLRVVTDTSLAYEALSSLDFRSYSPILALLRVVEPLFESLPQTFLQLYAMLLVWDETSSSVSNLFLRFISAMFSILCLAYAATDLCSADALAAYEGGEIAEGTTTSSIQLPISGSSSAMNEGLRHIFSFISSLFAPSRNMKGAAITLAGFGSIRKSTYFGLCFTYHIVEITSRFVSLALLAVAVQPWIFLLFLVARLGVISCIVRWKSSVSFPRMQPSDRSHPTFHPQRVYGIIYHAVVSLSCMSYRTKLRLVAIPFIDSILEGEAPYKAALGVTLVEFIACLLASILLARDNIALSAPARKSFAFMAAVTMVVKMALAW